MTSSLYGVFCTFGTYFAARGKNEVMQIYEAGYEHRTTPVKNAGIEYLGRLLTHLIEALSAALAGGFVVAELE